MDTINSLLNNADCNDLFSNDEMDGLYHAISASVKREYPNMIVEPRKFFNTRVRKNLHICLTLAPDGPIMRIILDHYSGLVSNTHVYWLRDWTEPYLLAEAEYFMRERLESAEMRDKLARCMSEVHSYMLDECRQVPWAGIQETSVTAETGEVAKLSAATRSTTPEKRQKSNSMLEPQSKTILHELIK